MPWQPGLTGRPRKMLEPSTGRKGLDPEAPVPFRRAADDSTRAVDEVHGGTGGAGAGIGNTAVGSGESGEG